MKLPNLWREYADTIKRWNSKEMEQKCQKVCRNKTCICVGNLAICSLSCHVVCDRLIRIDRKGPQLILVGERVCAGYEVDAGWMTMVWRSNGKEQPWLE